MGDFLTFASYNSNGCAPDRREYMKKILNKTNILFVQEHWLNDDGLRQLQVEMDSVFIYGKSGMRKNELLLGRPYGGVAIMVQKSLVCNLIPVTDVDNSRIFACILKLNEGRSLLLINMYMPYEDSTQRGRDEFINVLHDVDLILSRLHDEVNGIIIGGDFNVDLSRTKSMHTMIMSSFCTDRDLSPCVLHPSSVVDYTYRSRAPPFSAVTLDHFLVCDTLRDEVVEYTVSHDGDNLSDHCPVLMRIDLSYTCCPTQPRLHVPRVAWHRANEIHIANYQRVLALLLQDISVPQDAALCANPGLCEHTAEVEEHARMINAACMGAAQCCIPKTRRKRVAGWTDQVARCKERSLFWYRLWQQSGCPTDGEMHRCMVAAKREYKAAARRVMRNQENLSNARMADALRENHSRNFWSEVRKKAKVLR